MDLPLRTAAREENPADTDQLDKNDTEGFYSAGGLCYNELFLYFMDNVGCLII